MPSVLKDTRQFYSPDGELYLLLQVILLRSGIAFGSLWANKIPLKPKVLIPLLIYQKYHSVRSTEYWLELLFETNCVEEEKYKKMQNECGAIRRMLISSLKTVKSK